VTERLELGQLKVQLYNYEQLELHGYVVLENEVRNKTKERKVRIGPCLQNRARRKCVA
jgi:hypothetical protein